MRTALIFLLLLPTSLAIGSDESTEVEEEPFYQQLSRAIIRLESTAGDALGTAFFVHRQGDGMYYLVTARHVVEP